MTTIKKILVLTAMIAVALPMISFAAPTTRTPAKSLQAQKLEPIIVTGKLMAKTGANLRIVTDSGVAFSINISKAKLMLKSGKTATLSDFNINDQIKIEGQHAANKTYILANTAQDMSR